MQNRNRFPPFCQELCPKSGLTTRYVFAKMTLICNGAFSPSSMLLSNGWRRTFIQSLFRDVECLPKFRRHLHRNRECFADSILRERSRLSKRSASSVHSGDDWSCSVENRAAVGRNAGKFRQLSTRYERVRRESLWLPAGSVQHIVFSGIAGVVF